MTNGQSMTDDVLDGVDTEIAIDPFQQFTRSVPAFGGSGKQIAIEQRLDLHMPDQQFKCQSRRKVLDAKAQYAIDDPSFEPKSPAMEHELQRHKDDAQEEMGDRQKRADETVIKAPLLLIEQLIDVIGHIGKVLHSDRHTLYKKVLLMILMILCVSEESSRTDLRSIIRS